MICSKIHQTRGIPVANLVAGRLIKDGRIGKALFFEAKVVNYIDMESKWYWTPWRTVPDVSELVIILGWLFMFQRSIKAGFWYVKIIIILNLNVNNPSIHS